MSQRTQIFDLGQLRLQSGAGRTLDLVVPLEPFDLGGQRYEAEAGEAPVQLNVSHTTNGHALKLTFTARLHGPCMRCLEDADRETDVEAYEVDQPGGGDELSSPYLTGLDLNVASWARDALLLALPTQIVCSDDCRGLCVECGANLNEDPEHAHEKAIDPRWAALDELSLE